MKVTLLAISFLATAVSASMADHFVNNLDVSITPSGSSRQNGRRRGERPSGKRVLRGRSRFDNANKRELKNHKDHVNYKKKDDRRPYNNYGLNYFVPNYPDREKKDHYDDEKFHPGYNVRPRPSNSGESSDYHGQDKTKDHDEGKVQTGYITKPKPSEKDRSSIKDSQYTNPVTYDKDDKEKWEDEIAEQDGPERSEDDEFSNLSYGNKEKAKQVNNKFTEETGGWVPTPEPTVQVSFAPTVTTIEPSLSPTWSPTLEPTLLRESELKSETSSPTHDKNAPPTLEPTVFLTGAPTFHETGAPSLDLTGLVTSSPTFDETATTTTVSEADDGESFTVSTVQSITTTDWQPAASNITWAASRPQRTHAPVTPEPTLYVSTTQPTSKVNSLSPTLSPSISTNVSTSSPTISTPASTSNSPTYYPSYTPTTIITYSPTVDDDATTTAEATSSGLDCIIDFCEHQLSDDYLMEYKLNLPEGSSTDDCEKCSLTVRLTYDGVTWLGFAFSTDGQMVGSEAVLGELNLVVCQKPILLLH